MKNLNIVNRIIGVKMGDYLLIKDNNEDKIRYAKVFYIHPEKRYCCATVTGRFNNRYNECFTNEEIIILSRNEAIKQLKEKYGEEAEFKIKR